MNEIIYNNITLFNLLLFKLRKEKISEVLDLEKNFTAYKTVLTNSYIIIIGEREIDINGCKIVTRLPRQNREIAAIIELRRATGNADPNCLLRNPPVARRNDYTYFPGIGGYKLHSENLLWNQARITCEKEGGHLAIINSLAERDAVVTVLKAVNPHPVCVMLGFHDLYAAGHHVTIHGQTLARAGFDEWANGQPNKDGSESCGSLHLSGELHDHRCDESRPFVCEHPIH
ncbi:hemolymph lipopolysaccharide-binding protein-like isoform X1 [Neodiprion lecontei]|uniref:Hemolymph lipopolysaccharide-binding protein-like isoform X1 n=1 Tax=Neodiprion lecontei TaxID=441921 RepID=A0ABM3GK04_NEOLC|nr:hemolymph lipopolysaccharide-binding protein-like isoform X1 [Neodiprion lecontei]